MQLLTSFLLYGLGIGLQGLDLGIVAIVFFLQLIDFLAEILELSAFLPVDDHAVSAEHYMKKEPDCEGTHTCSC